MTCQSLSSKWPAAKARRGSMSFTTCDRVATQAPGHFQLNPAGRNSFAAIGKPYRLHDTERCYGSSSLVRPGPHSNEAGGSQLRHAPTFMIRQNTILNDNRVSITERKHYGQTG